MARAVGNLSEDLSCVTDVLGESAWKEKTTRTQRARAPRHGDQLETAGSCSDIGLRSPGRVVNCGRDQTVVIDTACRSSHAVNAKIVNGSAQHWIHAGGRGEHEAPTAKGERGAVGEDVPDDLAENILTVCNGKQRRRIERGGR